MVPDIFQKVFGKFGAGFNVLLNKFKKKILIFKLVDVFCILNLLVHNSRTTDIMIRVVGACCNQDGKTWISLNLTPTRVR